MSTVFLSTPAPSSSPSSLPSPPSSPSSSFSSLPSSLFSMSVPSSPPPSPLPPAQALWMYQSYQERRERMYCEGDDISHSLVLPSISLGRTSDSEKDSSGADLGRNVNDLLVVGHMSFVDVFVEGLVVGRRARAQGALYTNGNTDDEPRVVAEGKEGDIRIFAGVEAEWDPDEDESKAICIAQRILKILQSRPIFTALILLVSSPPTPLEIALHALVIPHIPILPVFSTSLTAQISRPSSRRRDTITTTHPRERPPTPPHVSGSFQPLTPRQLRHSLFRRKGVLDNMRIDALERRRISDIMGLRGYQSDGYYLQDRRYNGSAGLSKRRYSQSQSHLLDPLHVSSLMVLSFSLLRESARRVLDRTTVALNLKQIPSSWWFATAAFFAGIGVGWMWANI